jgi:hypothetical protein
MSNARPVTVSKTFSVTEAIVSPGRSDWMPVTSAAGMMEPAMSWNGDLGVCKVAEA